MKYQPLVSCIITFDTKANYLMDAVQSVLDQSYNNWELLLIGELSENQEDEYTECLRKYPDKIFHYSSTDHSISDLSSSRNFGITKARGEYIAFLDPDDVWLSEKLEHQINIMQSFPEAQLVYGRDIIWYDWFNTEYGKLNYCCELGLHSSKLVPPPDLIISLINNKYQTATISNSLMRKKLFDKIRFEKNDLDRKYDDQSFFTKVLMHEPVYVSTDCMSKIRTSPKETKSITEESEESSNRRKFLDWMHIYLDHQENTNINIRNVLNNELINLSSDKIEDIIRCTIPDFPVNEVTFLGQGVHNRTYRINNDYILRLPMNNSAKRSFLLEVNLLKLLKDRVALQIPEFIFVNNQSSNHRVSTKALKYTIEKIINRFGLSQFSFYHADNNNGNMFALYKEIKGSLLYPEFIHNASFDLQGKAAEDIAQFLTLLHSFPVEQTRKLMIREKKYDKKYYIQVLKLFNKHLQDYFDEVDKNIIIDIFSGDNSISRYTPSLLHGDLHWDHFIFNENTMRIIGVIDFGSVFIGDPAYDFTGIWRQYGEFFTRKVIQSYKVEDPDQFLNKIKLLYICEVVETAVQQLKTKNLRDVEETIDQLKYSLKYNEHIPND